MEQRTRIVCGYVRTPEGEAALEAAVQEARLRGAHLTVVHFSSPESGQAEEPGPGERELIEPGESSPVPEPAEPTFYDEELEWLERLLASRGIEHKVTQLPGVKSVAEDLLRIASAEAADLIVIGIRQRSRLGKFLLGSDAQMILLDAGCPVLAVKPRERR